VVARIETSTVVAKGVGRPDYSRSVSLASVSTLRGLQVRLSYTYASAELPTLAFPNVYIDILPWPTTDGGVSYIVPSDRSYHLQSLTLTSRRSALKVLALYQFASVEDYYAWNVEKNNGTIYGYEKLELRYSKGLPMLPGRIYVVLFSEWSAEPTFQIDEQEHTLLEEVVYG